MNVKRTLAVVIPIHNEEDNLRELITRLARVFHGLADWQPGIIFVDDGSTDASLALIRSFASEGHPVGFVALSRNFGHQAALAAGLQAAAPADAVLSMDGDLQHPPEVIPAMLKAFEDGADVVQMVRDRPAAGSKGRCSSVFYHFFSMVARTDIVPGGADFRLLSRRVMDALRAIPEREKFFRGLIPMLGFRQVRLPYTEVARTRGRPSYGFMRSLRLARKAVFDFSAFPLRLVFWFGFGLAGISFAFGVGHVVAKLLAWEKIAPGFTDLITSILFLSGCILAALGVLGRYLIMILDELRGRPPYVVAEHCPPPAGTRDPPDESGV